MEHKLRLEAVIFDMDGLLIDTETLVRLTWRQAATDCGVDLDESLFLRLVGRTRRDTHAMLQSTFGDAFSLDVFQTRCTARWEECIAETGIPLKPGVGELLDRLDAIEMPRAVATSTSRESAVRSLALAGVLDRFPHLVTGDQVERGKPAPDIFLRAAGLLRVEPARCLVLEDSPYGVMAAHAAGMVPVMVPDLVAPTDEIVRLAYAVVDSLDEVWPIIGS